MDKKIIASRLKLAMDRQGLKQKDVLELARPFCSEADIQLNGPDLSQYLSGKVQPGKKKLYVLAQTLGVSQVWLLGLTDNIGTFDSEEEQQLVAEMFSANHRGTHPKSTMISATPSRDDDATPQVPLDRSLGPAVTEAPEPLDSLDLEIATMNMMIQSDGYHFRNVQGTYYIKIRRKSYPLTEQQTREIAKQARSYVEFLCEQAARASEA